MSEEIKKETQDIELDQEVLGQVSGGAVLSIEVSGEKDKKTTDTSSGDTVLPEI